jgi:hypothetical protein
VSTPEPTEWARIGTATHEFDQYYAREVDPKLGDLGIGTLAIVKAASYNAWLASRGLDLVRALAAENERLRDQLAAGQP